MVWRDQEFSYGDLATRVKGWGLRLEGEGVRAGHCVAVAGDYSPESVSCLLALLGKGAILVPLSRDSEDQHESFLRIAEIDYVVRIDKDDSSRVEFLDFPGDHSLLQQLRENGRPGLILFSSGSTGDPKGIVHDLAILLEKFKKPRKSFRTINFLLFDHIGGVNTLFFTLANLGCIVVPEDRSVGSVCKTIQDHGVELLPTSPSFLNLLLMERDAGEYNLSSLRLITYGTEVMSERTLEMATKAFPHARFQQTYGLSEVGILRSKSAGNDSLFVKVGGEDYETKVVDGTLRIKARTSMLGYLNAPSPFDEEGWLDTGDSVVQDGEYYRFLGRNSDIINVGGQKVYPAEVEKIIAELPEVIDVAVRGEKHLLLGEVVVATVQMEYPESPVAMKQKIVQHCKGRLQPFMIPARVSVVKDSLVNYRYKKIRR
jgi:acyl-coenzyme A synthetase/AMP-(fatty) acid ligase